MEARRQWSLSGSIDVEPVSGTPFGLICERTDEFRKASNLIQMGRHLVVEIGCAQGLCTKLLVQHAGKQNVLALDISEKYLELAKENVGELDAVFALVDVLNEWGKVKRLVQQLKETSGVESPSLAVFVDVNGNRELDVILSLIPCIEEDLCPELLIVKAQDLHRHAQSTGLTEEGWKALQELGGKAFAARHTKTLGERSTATPHNLALRAPKRKTASGVLICRFYNYSVCRKGDNCPYDHLVCNSCSSTGHRASECTENVAYRFSQAPKIQLSPE